MYNLLASELQFSEMQNTSYKDADQFSFIINYTDIVSAFVPFVQDKTYSHLFSSMSEFDPKMEGMDITSTS
jgi:hypothetical protein